MEKKEKKFQNEKTKNQHFGKLNVTASWPLATPTGSKPYSILARRGPYFVLAAWI